MKKRIKTKQYILIFISILGSFMLVQFTAPHVFLANSPQLHPLFIAGIVRAPQSALAFLRNPLNPQQRIGESETAQMPTANPPATLVFSPITSVVRAAEDPATGKRYVRIASGTEVVVHTVTLTDGRVVKVYVPVE